MIIIPMRDLKNTVNIEKLCATSKAPVFVTKNGYGSLVVMNIECFEKILEQAYEAVELKKGMEDIENGRVRNGNDVLNDIKTKYGL